MQEGSSGEGGGGWTRVCDSCGVSPCVIYCLGDSAYLCSVCDTQIHTANRVASRHKRVWVCEVCKCNPAAFTCKSDEAALCISCDGYIHSANALAHRHHRIPILPISGILCVAHKNKTSTWITEDEESPLGVGKNPTDEFLFGGEYLDAMEYNSCIEKTPNHEEHDSVQQHDQYGANNCCDGVVPVQLETTKKQEELNDYQQQQSNHQLEYEASEAGFGYTSTYDASLLQPTEVGVVPNNAKNGIPNSYLGPAEEKIDPFKVPPPNIELQFIPMDRKSRVLRYREKRSARKFEKMVRYARRKAYAEARPRIRVRFAQTVDIDTEADHMFTPAVIGESGYGVVPSFRLP
ncbi:hypothetical protein GIB67_015865 [Kingdonia uniflora]|uniref:CONSTANS-like protein n=1 Tax=Kingdonia uniflora TaxID=39325 RepID=A0A7J7NGF5_9MAGN|nr:hypothetical protein GIB67_015865 [Kingdonia uniflora]